MDGKEARRRLKLLQDAKFKKKKVTYEAPKVAPVAPVHAPDVAPVHAPDVAPPNLNLVIENSKGGASASSSSSPSSPQERFLRKRATEEALLLTGELIAIAGLRAVDRQQWPPRWHYEADQVVQSWLVDGALADQIRLAAITIMANRRHWIYASGYDEKEAPESVRYFEHELVELILAATPAQEVRGALAEAVRRRAAERSRPVAAITAFAVGDK